MLKNNFLGARPAHNGLIKTCFCDMCKQIRYERYRARGTREVFREFKTYIPRLENKVLLKAHDVVLNLIVAGKVYKDSCLQGTHYVQFKSWANRQPQFADWSPTDLQIFCNNVNDAAFVYDNWDTIVHNLMDPRIDCLDAKRFSMGQLRQAHLDTWCLKENENMRRHAQIPSEPLYSEDCYNQLKHVVLMSPLWQEINHDPHAAAMITKRLQKDVLKYCKNQN